MQGQISKLPFAVLNAPPPAANLAEAIDQLGRAFEDYKGVVDERLSAIKKGQGTADVDAKFDKADKDIDALKAQLETFQAAAKRDNDELERRLGRNGLGGLGGGPSAERAQAAQFQTIRNAARKIARRVRPEDDDVDVEGYRNYCRAFEQAARVQFNSDNMSPEIRGAMSVGSDPDGGYFVPTEMSTDLEKRIYDTSEMRPICRVITIGAPAWEAPYMSAKGTSGGWVGEKQSRTSTGTPTVGMQRIETHEQYAYPELTQNMLDDAAIDVEAFLTDETEMEMSRTENTGFVNGNGVMQPKGFLGGYATDSVTTDDATRDWGVLQYVPSGQAAGFPTSSGHAVPDALITMIEKLHPSYRAGARWGMNRSVESAIRKLKDGDGRYLIGFGDLRDDAFGFTLLGFPISNLEDMPDLGSDSYSLALANWMRAYYIIDRIGFRVLRDPYTNKPYVGFYITKRVGGDVRNFDALKLMKFASS